jgi:uncharacterized DUF497 family protein
MDFSFDPAKDQTNREKHGLSLEFGKHIFMNAVTTVMDARFDYGEDRFVSFGYSGADLYVCVYVVREDTIRLISVRRANDRETRRYG